MSVLVVQGLFLSKVPKWGSSVGKGLVF